MGGFSSVVGLSQAIANTLYKIRNSAWLSGTDVYHGHDAIANETSTAYTKKKTITLVHIPNSVLQISFSLLQVHATRKTYGRVYKNGLAVGIERISSSLEWETFIESFSGLVEGDTIELWIHTEELPATHRCKELRILYNANATLVNS